jgi:hydroxyacylglutathione hydrolase
VGRGHELVLGDYRIHTVVTGRWRENCYVVHHTPSADAMVIDPGDDADAVLTLLREQGSRARALLITHAHYDHVGAVRALTRELDLAFFLHPADGKLLRRAALYAMSFERRNLETPGEGRDVTTAALALGGRTVRLLHTPGHTDGSMAYGFDGFAFTGDTMLYGNVGRADLPGGDPAQLRGSITQLLEWAPTDTILLPGHGTPWPIADARGWWQDEERRLTTTAGTCPR